MWFSSTNNQKVIPLSLINGKNTTPREEFNNAREELANAWKKCDRKQILIAREKLRVATAKNF